MVTAVRNSICATLHACCTTCTPTRIPGLSSPLWMFTPQLGHGKRWGIGSNEKKSQQECMRLQVSNQTTVSGGVAARKVLVLWMIRVDKATCCTTLWGFKEYKSEYKGSVWKTKHYLHSQEAFFQSQINTILPTWYIISWKFHEWIKGSYSKDDKRNSQGVVGRLVVWLSWTGNWAILGDHEPELKTLLGNFFPATPYSLSRLRAYHPWWSNHSSILIMMSVFGSHGYPISIIMMAKAPWKVIIDQRQLSEEFSFEFLRPFAIICVNARVRHMLSPGKFLQSQLKIWGRWPSPTHTHTHVFLTKHPFIWSTWYVCCAKGCISSASCNEKNRPCT